MSLSISSEIDEKPESKEEYVRKMEKEEILVKENVLRICEKLSHLTGKEEITPEINNDMSYLSKYFLTAIETDQFYKIQFPYLFNICATFFGEIENDTFKFRKEIKEIGEQTKASTIELFTKLSENKCTQAPLLFNVMYLPYANYEDCIEIITSLTNCKFLNQIKDLYQPCVLDIDYDYQIKVKDDTIQKLQTKIKDIDEGKTGPVVKPTNYEPNIIKAAERGDLQSIRYSIEKEHNSANIFIDNNRSPLYIAAKCGHLQIVKYLISKGAKYDVRTSQNAIPLHVAAQEGHLPVVEFLVNVGSDIESTMDGMFTPLYIASLKGHEKVVDYLLKKGANTEAKNSSGVTPLSIASQSGFLDIVKLLVQKGANINSKDNNGNTPLYFAASKGHIDIVDFLISKKANVNNTSTENATPLYIASQNGYFDIVQTLIDNGANPEISLRSGASPLYIAAQQGNLDIVQYLVNHGANIESRYKTGATPLIISVQNGHYLIVQFLLNHGADVTAKNDNGSTSLAIAKQKKYKDIVALLSGFTKT